MEVVTQSPLPVASQFWQSRPGSWVITFVAKATFDLQPGKAQLANIQEPIHEQDCHWDDDPARSVYAPSDLAPQKNRADVMLVGSAYAPNGQSVHSLFARLIVGELDKSVEVHRDRLFGPDGSLIEGPRFTRMSLAYERAAGGPGTTNPIGVRLDVRDGLGRVKLPNLQPPDLMIHGPGAAILPVGFGPISETWPVRSHRLGRYASAWSSRFLAGTPLPDDIDRAFFNAAPPDQQLAEIADDARIVMENLHPEWPRLVTNLPGLRPRAVFDARGGHYPLKMRADTLWIDSDRAIACLTFRSHRSLERFDEPGQIVISLEEAIASISDERTIDKGLPQGGAVPFFQPIVPRPPVILTPAPPVVTLPLPSPAVPPPIPTFSGKPIANSGVRASSRLDSRDILHLIWYHAASVARICKVPVWRAILQDMEKEPQGDDLDGPASDREPVEIEDRRDIFGILSQAASEDIVELTDELTAAVRPGNKFVPQLLLLAGELFFPFDERETLKAAVAIALTFATTDETFKNAVKDAKDLLASGPERLCPASLIEGHTARIRETFQRSRRTVPADTLDLQIERALLEGRHYQKRQVFGMNAVRALIHTTTGNNNVKPAPVYIPPDIAKTLPFYQRFRARIIVELYFQEDQYESHPAALKALALARFQHYPEPPK